jgi:type II secretory pathway predicted ATPase ExeA
MEKTGFERYGLSGNPFRDLSSENLEDVEIFHVPQFIDKDINEIREETLNKENKAVIALMGGLGAGKTERLLLLQNEAGRRGAFCVMGGVTTETQWMVKNILDSLSEKKGSTGIKGARSGKWIKAAKKASKMISKEGADYDPERIGHVIAEALNSNAPSFLLINDLHRLPEKEDMEQLLQILYVVTNEIVPGVMVVLSGDEKYFKGVLQANVTLNERINRKMVIPPLNVQEASLMIAKRLLAKRLVDDMDALYPFTSDSIAALNGMAKGNPRALLKYADFLLENAVKARAVQIDDDLVKVMVEQNETANLINDPEVEPSSSNA